MFCFVNLASKLSLSGLVDEARKLYQGRMQYGFGKFIEELKRQKKNSFRLDC